MRILVGLIFLITATIAVRAETVITNVTVLPMDGSDSMAHVHVTISGDRITRIDTQASERHAGQNVIDGTGKYLIPGLAEMHGHLPFTGWDRERTEDTLFLYLAGGVTTVRGMLGDPVQFDLRDRIKAGEIAGPTLYLAAPSLNGNSVNSPEEAIHKIRQYAAEGWDLQKIHPGLTLAEFNAMAETANALGYPFGGHVPADVGIERALKAGQISIDHMDGYISWLGGDKRILDEHDLLKAIRITEASDAWIVPTQALFNLFLSGGDIGALLARSENRYVSRQTVAGWEQTARRVSANANPLISENRQRLLKVFADAGVRVVMGSDAPQVFSVPGFSIWREIEVMKAAGLTSQQILQIGTKAAGDYFSDKDTFGTVSVGARADLILLEADPREDIMNITRQAGVIAAGRWYSRDTINNKLTEIAARHATD